LWFYISVRSLLSCDMNCHIPCIVVVVLVDVVRLRLWTAATNRPVVHPPDNIWQWSLTVEWHWQEKTENSGKNLPQCQFVNHKSHMNWPGREAGPPRKEAGD
jgi:hypothetical protein